MNRGAPVLPILVSLLLVALGGGADMMRDRVLASWSRPRQAEGGQTGGTRTLQATTSTGRQGAYFLPRDFETRALPLMVAFHGTGGTGSLMILRVQALAERARFIAVAPDSVSVAGAWVVGLPPHDITEDYRHVMDGVREVLRAPGVRVDPAHVLAAGFSVGGSVAPCVASHEDLFTAFAVLHGHVALDAMGPRRPRGWMSAGDRDRVRTVEQMNSAADQLRRRAGFSDLALRVFHVGHSLGDEELAALVAWWLR